MECLIEHNVTTSVFSHPIEQSWAECQSQFELVPNLSATLVGERAKPALIGSLEALSLLDRFVVMTDIALVSWHTGAIALQTPSRPDEIDDVSIELSDVSKTAEAVARATIHHFYGITVSGWVREGEDGEVRILEGGAALRARDQKPAHEYLSDLVRAWFILSSFPLTTHVLVVPKDLAEGEPNGVRGVVEDLHAIAGVANERRRELRRNLTDEFGLDRERLLAFQDEQTIALSKTARKGWLDLVRRTSRQMKLPPADGIEFVTVGHDNE